MAFPIKVKRSEDSSAKAHKMMGFKQGGRVKKGEDDKGTNIHISINAAPKPADAGAGAMPLPPPPPPPPPDLGALGMGGGMGGPPGMAGAGAGAGPIAMRRGGRVKGGLSKAASKTEGPQFIPEHRAPGKKAGGPVRKAMGGGNISLPAASRQALAKAIPAAVKAQGAQAAMLAKPRVQQALAQARPQLPAAAVGAPPIRPVGMGQAMGTGMGMFKRGGSPKGRVEQLTNESGGSGGGLGRLRMSRVIARKSGK